MADCICAVLLTCAAATAISQEWPLDLPAPNVPRQRDEARGLIQLDVVVTGESGAPVVGLNARDLSLLENGQAQKILSFQAFDGVTAKADPPVQIILVLDTIQLPEELARKERIAVESFLRKNGGKLERSTSIYWLTDLGLWTVAHPSDDGRVMARDIEHSDIRLVRPVVGSRLAGIPRSSTAPDPAPESALKALGQIASGARRVPGRKLLIWIGPGTGMGSGAGNMTIADLGERNSRPQKPFYTVCWFSALLRDARVTLYSLAVGEMEPNLQYKSHLGGVEFPQKAGYPNLDRKVLAVQSGGRVMDESFDLVKEIEDCVRGADAFYTLTFDPAHANRTDEYHEIKVEVDRPGLTARTNTGYYDQPFYSVERIPAVQRISVKELETLVDTSAGASDGDLARQLNELELTERLSGSRLAGIASKMRGKKSQMALVVLADASTFLDPPADEIPRAAEPDATAQRQMLARTAEYLKNTIPKLPDLFAKQLTVRYQETPQFHEGPTNVDCM
jgi:VWFA-related protein